MKLRPGTVSDAEAIGNLIASFQSELTDDPTGAGAEEYIASVSVDAQRRYLSSGRYSYIVAEQEGILVGFIALRDESHVFHLFVDRRHQHMGVARRLWEDAMTRALASSAPSQFTVNSSLGAVPVYRAFGFEAVGEIASVHGISFLPMRLAMFGNQG